MPAPNKSIIVLIHKILPEYRLQPKVAFYKFPKNHIRISGLSGCNHPRFLQYQI